MNSYFQTKHKLGQLARAVASSFMLFASVIIANYFVVNDVDYNLPIRIILPIASVAIVVILYKVLKKEVQLAIYDDLLTITHRITRFTRTYNLSQIDGFEIRNYKAKNGVITEIILFKDDKPIQVLSSLSVINFDELRDFLKGKLKGVSKSESKLKRWLNNYFDI